MSDVSDDQPTHDAPTDAPTAPTAGAPSPSPSTPVDHPAPAGTVTGPLAGPERTDPVTVLDMVWPETGLPVVVRVDRRPRDAISEGDAVHLEVDFVTLTLTPLEFIQLAASLRLSVDALLEQHPGLQRAVIAAFDLRRDDR